MVWGIFFKTLQAVIFYKFFANVNRMKKSLLTFIIATIFTVAICEAGETLHQLQQELESVKSELEQARKNTALQVEIVKIFDKQEIIQPKEDEEQNERTVTMLVSMPKTNLIWLNELLNEFIHGIGYRTYLYPMNTKIEMKSFEDIYQDLVKSVKEGNSRREEYYSVLSRYLGKRNNIATFTVEYLTLSGNGYVYDYYYGKTFYINVDLAKQSQITLEDLIDYEKHPDLKEMLWDIYTRKYSEFIGLDEKKEASAYKNFRISDDFYFNTEGINFVYSPLELIGLGEGNTVLTVYWKKANHLLKSDYRQTEKDGIY